MRSAFLSEVRLLRTYWNAACPFFLRIPREIIFVLIALACWRQRVTGASVVCYIDNDAARSACIKALGATCHARSLMASVSHLKIKCQCKAWYARVPASSNIADAPSRLRFDQVKALGAVETEIRWTEVAEALGAESIGRFPKRGRARDQCRLRPFALEKMRHIISSFISV